MFKSKIFQQITSWGLFFYKPVAHIKDVYKPNHFHQKRNGLKKSCNRFKQIREGITQKETITIKWNTVSTKSMKDLYVFTSVRFFIALLFAKFWHQTLQKVFLCPVKNSWRTESLFKQPYLWFKDIQHIKTS